MANRSDETKVKEASKEQPHAGDGGSLAPAHGGAVTPYGWDPFSDFREEMHRMFDNFLAGWRGLPAFPEAGRWHGWGMDVQEDNNHVTVRAEAPGFEASDFDIQTRGDQLILRATRKAESTEKERGYREWRRHEFYHSVSLPPGTATDKIDAEYRNGVLTVKVPKTEQSKGRRIQVRS